MRISMIVWLYQAWQEEHLKRKLAAAAKAAAEEAAAAEAAAQEAAAEAAEAAERAAAKKAAREAKAAAKIAAAERAAAERDAKAAAKRAAAEKAAAEKAAAEAAAKAAAEQQAAEERAAAQQVNPSQSVCCQCQVCNNKLLHTVLTEVGVSLPHNALTPRQLYVVLDGDLCMCTLAAERQLNQSESNYCFSRHTLQVVLVQVSLYRQSCQLLLQYLCVCGC